jgi:hypothetical protein
MQIRLTVVNDHLPPAEMRMPEHRRDVDDQTQSKVSRDFRQRNEFLQQRQPEREKPALAGAITIASQPRR